MKTNFLFALLFTSLFGFSGGPLRLLKRQVNDSLTYVAYTETGGQALLGARYLSAVNLLPVKIGTTVQDTKTENLHAGPYHGVLLSASARNRFLHFLFYLFLIIRL